MTCTSKNKPTKKYYEKKRKKKINDKLEEYAQSCYRIFSEDGKKKKDIAAKTFLKINKKN